MSISTASRNAYQRSLSLHETKREWLERERKRERERDFKSLIKSSDCENERQGEKGGKERNVEGWKVNELKKE